MFKLIKAFAVVIILVAAATFVFIKFDIKISAKKPDVQAQEKLTIRKTDIKINKEAVFGKMTERAVIVGLEKEITKTNGVDNSGETGWKWFDDMALSKKLVYEAHGRFLMGLDMKEFGSEDISVDQETGTVTVVVPQPTLISLELPYEDCTFTYERGWFRRHFTKKDEQMIWKQIRTSAEEDIRSDEESLLKAKELSYAFIESMLIEMEGVKQVTFVEK